MNNDNKVIKSFYLFTFLNGFHMFSAVLMPFYVDWGGVSLAVGQALQSWFMLCVFLMEIPTGVVADMIGRKRSLFIGSLTIVLATLVYGVYPHLALFIAAEFLFACGVAFFSGADQALLYDTLVRLNKQDTFKEVWGKSRSIHLLAIAFAAVLGSFLAKNISINAPMLLTSIPAFLAAIVAYQMPEPAETGKIKEQRNFFSVLNKGLIPLRQNHTLRYWTVNATFVAAAAYFVIWLYQPLMLSLNLPLEYYGVAHAVLIASEIAISANFGRIVKLFGSLPNYLNISGYVVAGSFLSVALFPNMLTFLLFLFFAGGVGLTRLELMRAEMNNVIRESERATTLSTISMFQRVSYAALNPFIGFLTDKSVFVSLLVVSLLPLLTFLVPIKEEDE